MGFRMSLPPLKRGCWIDITVSALAVLTVLDFKVVINFGHFRISPFSYHPSILASESHVILIPDGEKWSTQDFQDETETYF